MNTSVEIRLARWDREGGGDHLYGQPFDKMLDDIVGGPARWSSPREESSKTPRAKVKGADVSVELHEDGPLIQFVIEQIPGFVSAFAAVISAWLAWRSSRKEPKIQDLIDQERRHIEVSVGSHHYRGQATAEQVKEIALFLSRLT